MNIDLNDITLENLTKLGYSASGDGFRKETKHYNIRIYSTKYECSIYFTSHRPIPYPSYVMFKITSIEQAEEKAKRIYASLVS